MKFTALFYAVKASSPRASKIPLPVAAMVVLAASAISNNGKIMVFAGGVPLKQDGKVVGAIGVSGGSGDQGHAVAAAGAAAF